MVQNRSHISRLRQHFGMILQDPDIQPEPRTVCIFYPRKQGTSSFGGPLFHKAGEHFACRMSLSKGFSKFRASFPKLGTKQGV